MAMVLQATTQQIRILRAMRGLELSRGIPATFAEIGEVVGVQRANVHTICKKLLARGYVVRIAAERRPRNLRVADGLDLYPPTCPKCGEVLEVAQ